MPLRRPESNTPKDSGWRPCTKPRHSLDRPHVQSCRFSAAVNAAQVTAPLRVAPAIVVRAGDALRNG